MKKSLYIMLFVLVFGQFTWAQEDEDATILMEEDEITLAQDQDEDLLQMEQEDSLEEEDSDVDEEDDDEAIEQALEQEDMSESEDEAVVLSNSTEKVAISIGLDENNRSQVVEALKSLQADEFKLYAKTWKYHWNIQGQNFGPLHELFGKQYAMLAEFVDGVAERIRAFGFYAPGTLTEFGMSGSLDEQVGRNPSDLEMIADLLKDHEQIIRNLRGYVDLTAKLNDMGTNNYLADLLTKHEKMAWMLRAHLEK